MGRRRGTCRGRKHRGRLSSGQFRVTYRGTVEPGLVAVDLGSQFTLAEMEIWNRSDCCAQRLSNYWVLVSPTPIATDSLQEALAAPGATAVRRGEAAGRPTTIGLDGVRGRHVRVQLESASDPLSLTEVVVRAVPQG